MYLLTSTGTFTSGQYDSIIESTKMAIDGVLNVFSALMPVYALLGAMAFGIAFVLLLLHIIKGGCDMEKATAPINYSWDSYKTKSPYDDDSYFYDYDNPYKNRQRYWYLKHKYKDEIDNDYHGDFGRWFNHKYNK